MEAGRRRLMILISLGLVGLVLGVFLQTRHHAFINYDDDEYVYENRYITGGLTVESFVWAIERSHASNWHPLTWYSHMLDWWLFGDWAGGHHLMSVGLHALTAVLLFVSLTRLTGDLWPSAFVCAVFAIHPLRVESVAWVAERKDVLSGLFFAWTLLAYSHYVRKPTGWRYLLLALCFALGLMAKPMLVTLPCVLLLLDYWPLGRITDAASFRQRLWEKLPLFSLTVLSAIVTVIVQEDSIGTRDNFPLELRAKNAVVSYAIYIRQTLWPVGLAVIYPYPKAGISSAAVLGAAVVLAAITGLAWMLRRQVPAFLVGWLWYLGMLVPVIGFVQVGLQAHADRYTYLPQLGLLIAVAWGFAAFRLPRILNAVLAGVVLMGCFVLARQQTALWRDAETLFTHTLVHTPPNAVAHTNMGSCLLLQQRYDESISHSLRALELDPALMPPRKNLSRAHQHLGDRAAAQSHFTEAIAEYRQALEYDPTYLPLSHMLALAYLGRGREFVREKRLDDAIREFQTAIQIEPDLAAAHAALAATLRIQRQK